MWYEGRKGNGTGRVKWDQDGRVGWRRLYGEG